MKIKTNRKRRNMKRKEGHGREERTWKGRNYGPQLVLIGVY